MEERWSSRLYTEMASEAMLSAPVGEKEGAGSPGAERWRQTGPRPATPGRDELSRLSAWAARWNLRQRSTVRILYGVDFFHKHPHMHRS